MEKFLFFSGRPLGTQGTLGTYKLIDAVAKSHPHLVVAQRPLDGQLCVKEQFNFQYLKLNKVNIDSILSLSQQFQAFNPDIIWIFNHPNWFEFAKVLRLIFPQKKIILDIQTPLLIEGQHQKYILSEGQQQSIHIDAIFTLDKNSALSWLPNFTKPIFEYPLGIDTDVFLNNIDNKNVLQESKKYVYIGAVHPKRKIDIMVHGFIDYIQETRSKDTLDIYGGGPLLDEIKKIVKIRDAEKFVNIRGLVEHSRLALEVSNFDVGIAWVPKETFNDSPSLKVFEYFLANLSVIATNTNAHLKLKKEDNYNLFYSSDTREGLKNSLIDLQDKELAENEKKTNYQIVLKRSYENIFQTSILPYIKKINVVKKELKLNIVILINSLAVGKGGAERVAMELADEMSIRGHNVSIHYLGNIRELPAYRSKHGVKELAYSQLNLMKNRLRFINPDVYFCFYFNRQLINYYKQCYNLNVPFGMQECTNPDRLISNNWRLDGKIVQKPLALWERELIGARASRIRLVMPSYRDSFNDFIKPQVRAFSNPSRKMDTLDTNIVKENVILSINGFKANKNLITLVKAFATIADTYPNWKIIDIGKQPDMNQKHVREIFDCIEKEGLSDRVLVLGPQDNVDSFFAKSSIHVIASLSEGCPTVILEAMAHGVPSIGFDDCPGTNELISDMFNGLLANSEDRVAGLAKVLGKLIEDEDLRTQLGEECLVDSKRFVPENIYDQWEKLFFDMAEYKNDPERLFREQMDIDPEKALHAKNMIKTLIGA
ncbi:glycosyltransferase [Sulfurimonas microaerophilic]|uniref:glycosyltransferase n=1 Tax=Sulfurimonas microaerophilic TaxID=3058392 RepID=UPI00271468BC|nr:glycosyltransferase [Sulfurimonas sp. hsl 1-7]